MIPYSATKHTDSNTNHNIHKTNLHIPKPKISFKYNSEKKNLTNPRVCEKEITNATYIYVKENKDNNVLSPESLDGITGVSSLIPTSKFVKITGYVGTRAKEIDENQTNITKTRRRNF